MRLQTQLYLPCALDIRKAAGVLLAAGLTPLFAQTAPALSHLPPPATSLVSPQPLPPALPAASAHLPAATHYDPNNPPQGIFDDEWMEISMMGQKVGYLHIMFRREGDRVLTEDHEVFKIGRATNVMEISSETTTEETLDGKLRAFHSSSATADQPTLVNGQGDGREFDVTVQTGKYTEKKHITLADGSVSSWGQQRLMLLKGFAPNTRYQVMAYDPSNEAYQSLLTQISVGEHTKLKVLGQDVDAVQVNLQLSAKSGSGGIDTTVWLDADGRTMKLTVPMGGLTMDAVATTREQALAAYMPTEVFDSSLITLGKTLPANATTVVFHLQRKDGKPLPAPPESANEHGEVLPDGSVNLTLTHALPSTPSTDQAVKDTAPFLARNAYMDTADPLLKDIATQLGGPEDALPPKIAAMLRDCVTNYITKKDLSVGFATASEAAQRREGDCTEHAVMLAALGRIRGIPTRVISGLAYMPEYQGQHGVLGFHMWAQFYLGGRWVDYDSALNDSKRPQYWRLGLVADTLNDVSLSDFSLQLMSWMADMKVTADIVNTPATH